MDELSVSTYLQVHSDALQVVRQGIKMDKPGEMKNAVRILDEWLKQHPDFINRQLPLHYLEMTIVSAKGSLERAKRNLESLGRARTLSPDYFSPRCPTEHYEMFKNNFRVLATRRLTSEYHRVLIIRAEGSFANDVIIPVYKFAYGCIEYIKAHDYNSGTVVIFDVVRCDIGHFMTHVNLLQVKDAFLMFLNIYALRLKRCHLITESKLIHTVINIFTPFLSKKHVDRVVINKSAEELLDYYPKDSLPKDYGGTDQTIQELQDFIVHNVYTAEVERLLKSIFEVRIDKSKCVPSQISESDDLNGTFRALNID